MCSSDLNVVTIINSGNSNIASVSANDLTFRTTSGNITQSGQIVVRNANTTYLTAVGGNIILNNITNDFVGGIHANNTQRAEFLYDNLMIESLVIHQAYLSKVKKLLFLGSSCIYPKEAPQPLREEYLLSAPLEATNEPYALAKIAGIKLCENYRRQYGCDFISVMPSNLYGPNDSYHLENAHVLPTLIRKCHEAKIKQQSNIELWGTGKPKREFLHVNDLARACVFLMKTYSDYQHINVGTGTEISIAELAQGIAEVVGYNGTFTFNSNMPDGTFRKVLDVSKINRLGWKAEIKLFEGIREVYQHYAQGRFVKSM